MSFLVPSAGHPPAPPPPPPMAPQLSSPSIMASGQAEKEELSGAEAGGLNGTDVTGGQGSKAPATTKTLLGQ